jgi:hypothetical protein
MVKDELEPTQRQRAKGCIAGAKCLMKFDVLGGGFKTNREFKTEIRKAVSSKKIQRLRQLSERKIASVK